MTRHLLLASLAILAACSTPREQPKPADLMVLRNYGWDTTVEDPQPAWNPANNQVVVRSAGGLGLLDEGRGNQSYFSADDKRTTGHPQWLAVDELIFGPTVNAMRGGGGLVVGTTDGITDLVIGNGGIASHKQISGLGYRPRVGRDSLWVQVEDRICTLQPGGEPEPFADGFFAEPQRDGPGVAYQETPVTEEDYWTGRKAMGRLVVRWKPGVVSYIERGLQARWLPGGGGLVATVLRSEPLQGRPWTSVPSDVVLLSGPGAAPKVVAEDARSPAPHPTQPFLAVASSLGGVRILGLAGGIERQLSEVGHSPQWNHDGSRLLFIEPPPKDSIFPFIKVLVLGLPERFQAPAK